MLINQILVHGPRNANLIGEPLAPVVHCLERMAQGTRAFVDGPPEPRHRVRFAIERHQLEPINV